MPANELTQDAISFNATVASVRQGSQWQIAQLLLGKKTCLVKELMEGTNSNADGPKSYCKCFGLITFSARTLPHDFFWIQIHAPLSGMHLLPN